jgi:CRP/FNR family cyclic AMP-dependent transcriptional regulator
MTDKPTKTERWRVDPAELRKLKVFSSMSNGQVLTLLRYAEHVTARGGRPIVKMREAGDCMYVILDGEVRVCQPTGRKETVLATLEKGDFFGEICLFDEGPRSADVVANSDCSLLKIEKRAFSELVKKDPDIAAQFLYAVVRAVGARLRTMNKKYTDSMMVPSYWDVVAYSK